MYSALWRALPGPGWFRAIILICLALVLVWLCFEFFFPWLSTVLPFNQLTVDAPEGPLPSVSTTALPAP